MNENANLYFDKNAYIQRVKVEEKKKVDLNHIEKVMYPVNYDSLPEHFDKDVFTSPKKDTKPSPQQQKPQFDISKLLPLLMNKGDMSSLLPNLLSSFNGGMGKDILPLIKNFASPKKVEAKVVESFSKDSISKYPKIE